MKKIIFLFAVWFVTLLFINKFSPLFLTNRTDYELYYDYSVPFRATIMPWFNFDARHYLDIAVNGSYEPVYTYEDGVATELNDVRRAYFPLFPFVIHSVTLFGRLNPVFAGLFLNYILTAGSLILLYKLFTKEFSERIALKSIVLLLFFPTSFYLVAYYSEALYLFLSVLTFYFLNTRKNLQSAIAAGLAGLTRLAGLALLPVLIYDAWKSKNMKRRLLLYALAPLGILSYMIYSYFDIGSATAFMTSMQSDTFARTPSLVSPVFIMKDLIEHVLTPSRHIGQMHRYLAEVLEMLSVVLLIFLAYYGLRRKTKHTKAYVVYILSTLGIILVSGSTTSLHRYVMVIFPLYPLLSEVLSTKRYVLWLAVSGILFVICSSLFLRGYWVT